MHLFAFAAFLFALRKLLWPPQDELRTCSTQLVLYLIFIALFHIAYFFFTPNIQSFLVIDVF